ncbi:N-acetylmuramoyl-L-alanine amidase [Gordonia rubripertincta]|uniref:N-acetylmuramoyl-L-alanine amidase n=2 Tax=Gordonia rubripertincta TaxID=36822 RepID=A0AAW6REU3_GORRU|nr:N-acetylmuramoyl-L-alanine amidase [Gordonia rubripertincta]ASR05537.1 N-acetylmuramoyl-L-alanine amidase LytC precursor [Gordonia rubripertincta]MBM7276186.1 peptidoglycan-binding protein [Gordonia rubripertincta]MDG6782788.1 N-acetylmuramoyl-L-alanine amidase [Gordonia rubripertincta]NKY63997.1 N-acetylmuramoyl-L-alanine amidase [Gordonia rubripertincta]QMU21759.1 peptidoglycan-binding protein [Gordonia rubripertincta]
MPLFRLGDHGSAVAEIRAILVGLGLLPDGGDPVFDEACDRAIRAFQQQRGLIVDGIVGPATYRVLREASYRLGARVLSYQLSAPMVGDDVATLQHRLQNLGYYTSLVDGIFGLNTHNAVCLYQSEYGLASDGICGPATLRSLERLGTRVTGGSPYAIRQEEQVRRSGPQLSGKRILIDPGSGGLHPLSTGELAERESDLLWDLGARLEGRMAAAGMQTFLSHDGRGRPGDNERARVANLMDADMMISLRCGHYRNAQANGVASFYFGNNQNSFSTIGRNLAGFIQREIAARTPLADCRTHERTWDVLRLTRMPVALIDVGYITNPDDAAVLGSSDWRNVIADAILVAVKRLYLLDQDDRPTGTYTFADLLAAENASR